MHVILQHHGTEPFLAICVGNCILKCNATAIQLLSMVRATPRLRPHNDAVVWTSVRSMTEYGPELKLFVLKSSMSWHCFEIKHVHGIEICCKRFADIVKYSSWARM